MDKIRRKRFSFRERGRSFRYAFNGIQYVIRSQHNFGIDLIAAVIAVGMGLLFRLNETEWGLMILACGFVLFAEVANTAIESLVDMVSPQFNEQAGRIKDIAAGAVLIAAITAAIIGIVIFLPKIYCFISS
jgi:diacylglycerol kinase (ATP)